jgi:hypothetical protein
MKRMETYHDCRISGDHNFSQNICNDECWQTSGKYNQYNQYIQIVHFVMILVEGVQESEQNM